MEKQNKSIHIKKISELLPTEETHMRNRVKNKENLSKSVHIEIPKEEVKTVDEKIQELI